MELRPHDLIQLTHPAAITSFGEQPDWVAASLARAPFAVIRRVPPVSGMAPIGIRGEERAQRFAAFVRGEHIGVMITPEQLADDQPWIRAERFGQIGALQSLPFAASLLASHSLVWGPVGSVGFELASGVPTAKPASDLDLVVRVPERLEKQAAAELFAALWTCPVRVDVQLDTPYGAVALAEYARTEGPLLLKTLHGPRLTADPWNEAACFPK